MIRNQKQIASLSKSESYNLTGYSQVLFTLRSGQIRIEIPRTC